jgi:RNA polymerase sigma factor (sigma-70 family)
LDIISIFLKKSINLSPFRCGFMMQKLLETEPELMSESLESLVVRAQTGDHAAYSVIMQRFQDMALKYAFAIVGDYELAEDARQEAFLGAYCDLMTLREPAAFPGWFRRIVQKHSVQIVRQRRRLMLPLEDAGEVRSTTPLPDQAAAAKEQEERLAEVIGGLPASEGEVTRLFYFEDRSLKEISESLQVPVQTVKSRLHTARARLRQRLMEIVKKQVRQQGRMGDRRALHAAAGLAVEQFDEELKGLLRVLSPEDQQHAVDLLCGKGRLLRLGGRMDEARAAIEEGLAHPVLSKDPVLRLRLRTELGLTWVQLSDYERARGELQPALTAARKLAAKGNPALMAAILNGLGMCAWGQGDLKRARTLYEEAAATSHAIPCPELEAEARNNLALINWKMGRLDQALAEFRDGLAQWKKLHNRHASALTTMNLAVIEENMGRNALARRHYGQALDLARAVQFVQVEAATLSNLSNLALGEDHWQDAWEAAAQALELARTIGDRRSQAIALENQALASLGLRRFEQSAAAEEEARGLAKKIGDQERLLSLELVAIERAAEQLAAGTAPKLLERLEQARQQAERMGLLAELPRILRLKVRLHLLERDLAQTRRILTKALTECRRQKNKSEERRLLALQDALRD